jgi:hypothetical protein
VDRRVTSREGAKRTRFSQFEVQHNLSFIEQAQEHCSKRNNAVVHVLTYIAVLRGQRADFQFFRIKESPALWQNAHSERRQATTGDFEMVWEPGRGYGTNEAAHWLPCSLTYDDKCISALCDNIYAERLVRDPFGEVSDLPAIYNDADQRAEDAGLRHALVWAARRVAQCQQHNTEVDYTAIRHIYHHDWVPRAQLAYTKALNAIAPLRDVEKLRRQRVERDQFSGIDPADLQIDRDALFYDELHDILTAYAEVTAKRTPLDLQQHELEAVITGFKTAADPKRRTRWPRKIALAK